MRSSLSIKILLPTLLTIAVGILSVSFFSYLKARSVVREELGNLMQREVRITTQLMDRWLEARIRDIEAWSSLDISREALTESGYYGASARRGAHEFLANLEQGYPCYDLLFLAGVDGRIIASSHQFSGKSIDVSARAYFRQNLEGENIVSDVITSMESGREVFIVSSPVYAADGKIAGILAGAIDLSFFSFLFVDDLELTENGWAFIVDKENRLIAISSGVKEEGESWPSGYIDNITMPGQGLFSYQLAGGKTLNAFGGLRSNNWRFCITLSQDEALDPLYTIARFSVYLSILILVAISVIIGFLFKNLIISRLSKILESISRVREGDLERKIPADAFQPDEITELKDSFNIMTDQLDRTVTELREEINIRKETESELAHHQENLEDIIRKRGLELEREVNERKAVEEKLHRAEKMEMIGTLAGGVAHDLNNILSGIVSYPDLLLRQVGENSPLSRPLKTIKESGQKASAVVQDLLTLARRGVTVKEVVDLNQVIKDYLSSPEFRRLGTDYPDVSVHTHLAEDLLPVSGSSVHLEKTVMNLVVNGVEAMARGGEMQIITNNTYVEDPIEQYDVVPEGDYAVMIFRDEGHGIKQEEIDKIFEPFYTSKKMGKSGTGLGMAVVWGTVKDHNGFITCESSTAVGTVFTLYLPVTSHVVPKYLETVPLESLQGNNETILVVDDVYEQREIASAILSELGYDVASVSSGEEAIIVTKERKFDLLILDMILEDGIDGFDTFRAIRVIHPDQKAIITSGYSETERITEALKLGAGQYVKKPYMMYKIGLAVQSELARGS